MKWETVKNRCIKIANEELASTSSKANWSILLAQLIKEGSGMLFHDAEREAREKCYSIIENWDIRQWQSLKNRFPKAFPVNLKQPELTEKGWELL